MRKEKINPLPGDNVEISPVQDEEKPAGNVDAILLRKNVLIRPAVANVDQALVVFAAASPKPNLNLLDRFLISMEQQRIPVVICFNKTDLISTEEEELLRDTYVHSYPVQLISAANGEGIEDIQRLLDNGCSRSVRRREVIADERTAAACADGGRRHQPQDRAWAPYDAPHRADLPEGTHVFP